MLFKKYVIKLILEAKYKNNPRYQLLPARSYSYVDKKGRSVVVSDPKRWKRTDKSSKNKQPIDEKTITVYIGEEKLDINYQNFGDRLSFTHNLHEWNKVKLNEINTNPYNLSEIIDEFKPDNNIIRLINKERKIGKKVEDLIMSLAISKNDEVKLDYIDYFISEDYFKDLGERLQKDLRYDKQYSLLPTYRHFLQLFLSLDDSKILNDSIYRNAFKFLLTLDWIQHRYHYSSVLESILLYATNVFGKEKIAKFFNLDKSLLDNLKYMNKVPVPLLNVNKDNFINSLYIIKEMREESQEILKDLLDKSKSLNLYRGIILERNFDENIISNFKNLNEKQAKEKVFDLIEKNQVKLFESWTENVNVATEFAKLDNVAHINLLSESELNEIENYLNEYRKKEGRNPISFRIGIVLNLDVDKNKNVINNIFITYHSIYKYWKNIRDEYDGLKSIMVGRKKENKTFYRSLPVVNIMEKEKEYLFFSGLLKNLNPDNVYFVGLKLI